MTKKLLLYFDRSETDQPIVYRLVKDFDIAVNIFRAKVTPDEYGYLVLDVTGADADLARGIDWLESLGIRVSESNRGLSWNEERCTGCGNCLSHCPTGALCVVDDATRRIGFDGEKCIECLSCIENCPFGACSSIFADG
jgi:L-aspartate semialdehyde sulfurtransferase ferredoxin